MYDPNDPTAPKVSVVMPVHNAAAFLRDSVASVQAQTMPDWELIAVDDGSDDGSDILLAELAAKDGRIKPQKSAGQQGAGAARNRGMDAARGRFVAFLDADDLWHPEKLQRQLAAMGAASSVLSCTAFARWNSATGRRTLVGVPQWSDYRRLLGTNTVACSTAMMDRAFFGECRMSLLKRRQDFLFWLHLLQKTPRVLGVPDVLMTYRVHGESLSAAKHRAAADTWTMYRAGLGLSLPMATWAFGQYALRGFVRHKAPRLAKTLHWLHEAREVSA